MKFVPLIGSLNMNIVFTTICYYIEYILYLFFYILLYKNKLTRPVTQNCFSRAIDIGELVSILKDQYNNIIYSTMYLTRP